MTNFNPIQNSAAEPFPERRNTTLVLACGLICAFATQLAKAIFTAKRNENLVSRCEELSDLVGKILVAHDSTADSAEIRRQNLLALRACLDDYDANKQLTGAE
jgi:hypothetical protein